MLHKEGQQPDPEEKAIQSLEKSVRGYQEALEEIEKVKSMKRSRTESSEVKMDEWAKKINTKYGRRGMWSIRKLYQRKNNKKTDLKKSK